MPSRKRKPRRLARIGGWGGGLAGNSNPGSGNRDDWAGSGFNSRPANRPAFGRKENVKGGVKERALERLEAGGDVKAIETRKPPDDMHDENFADVLGDKPVVLLMATPALCQSRVCGPVTDIAAQLQKEYGDRAVFIHQEVYEDNDVQKGLREPLREFGLRTEPWLFTFTRDGRVAARLEGSFGNGAFRRAVEAALDG